MPPKTSTSKAAKASNSNKEALDAINSYLAQKPDFEKLIKEAKESSRRSIPEQGETEYTRKVKAAVKEVLEERQKQAK